MITNIQCVGVIPKDELENVKLAKFILLIRTINTNVNLINFPQMKSRS